MATWIDYLVLGLCAIVAGCGMAQLGVIIVDSLIEYWNKDDWKD